MKTAASTLSVFLFVATMVIAQGPNETEPPLPEGAVARLGTLRLRHSGEGECIVFSPDGKILAATNRDGDVSCWSTETGRRLRVLTTGGWVNRAIAIAYSPDGKTLAVDTMDRGVVFFDSATGKQTHSFTVEGPIGVNMGGSLAWSPDGESLAVARQGNVLVVDSRKGNEVFRYESNAGIQDLKFSADGKKLLAGTLLPATKIWDLATKKCLHKLDAQEAGFSATLSPDGRRAATGVRGEVVVWNAETGKEECRLIGEPSVVFLKAAFTPDGRSLIAGDEKGLIYEWDLRTRTQTQRFRDEKMHILRTIALSSDGKKIAASFAYNSIRLWDRKTGKMLFSDKPEHTSAVEAVAFSTDGKTLVTGSGNQTIHLWESPSGRHLKALESQNSASMAAFSPNKRLLATAWKWGPRLQIWDAESGTHLRELNAGGMRTRGIAFIKDGKELVALTTPRKSGSARLTRWAVESGKQLQEIERNGSYRSDWFAVSPQGEWAVVGDWDDLELWQLSTGQVAGKLSRPRNSVESALFTPDGGFLVAGSQNQSLYVWEMATAQIVLTLAGHTRPVTDIAISPDGRTIASGGGDHSIASDKPHKIRYWNLYTGKELAHHTGHDENTTALAFSPDGKYLASGLRDTTALIWAVPESVRNSMKTTEPPGAQELEAAWQQLKDENAKKAYQAMAVLTSADNAAVLFLKDHLKPPQPIDGNRIQELLKKLDDDEFAVRSRAQEELIKLGDLARKTIEEFANKTDSLEAKTRALAVVESLNLPFVTGQNRLRNIRAIQVLGRIGTPEASTLLEKLSEGTGSARETQEAKRQLKLWQR